MSLFTLEAMMRDSRRDSDPSVHRNRETAALSEIRGAIAGHDWPKAEALLRAGLPEGPMQSMAADQGNQLSPAARA
jgi:hypothetical protein